MTQKLQIVKMRAGKYYLPVTIQPENGRLYFQFPFNRDLMAEVKAMKGARWHGYDETNPRKVWSVTDCARNKFQIEYLLGRNPYKKYEEPLLNITPRREECYEHQGEMIQHGVTRKQCILACEMRTGKTLAAIEIMELSGITNWLWVGPKASLAEIQLQFETWKAKIYPTFLSYDMFRRMVQDDRLLIPDGIIFDEATKLKTPTSQRSQAASIITEEMRKKNPDAFILLMSGAPAPNSPSDWWHQCEIACPGFLREGDIIKFKKRLCLIEEKESFTGGTYPELVTWFDDEKKCAKCGKHRDEHFSTMDAELVGEDHPFEPSKNEVAYLYERMKGLVLVKFRKDCLDLPKTQYRVIRVEPDESTKRAAKLITRTAPRAITALMLLRELSDGFQYREEKSGTKTCELCGGSRESAEFVEDPGEGNRNSENNIRDTSDSLLELDSSTKYRKRKETCSRCKGTGEEPKLTRIAKEVACPKEQVLIDLLDEHEPIGRFVVYAGFQASVDRCVKIALRYHWDVIRVDGRGWAYFSALESNEHTYSDKDMLKKFQDKKANNKIVFIGQPGAAGMGITLTASPSVFYYSNSFNGEDRIQSIERVQGIGMDLNRGATIIDVIHLESDQLVLNNLAKKKELLDLSMGKLREVLNVSSSDTG